MKSSLRNLSLWTLSLIVGACAKAEPTPARAAKEAAPHAVELATVRPVEAPSLTATSPATPPSVAARAVDAPAEPKTPAPAITEEPEADAPAEPKTPLEPSDVHVDRFLLTTGVVDREPVDEENVFSADAEKIFAFVQVANPEGAPYSFKVHFESVDKAPSPYGITLDVPTSPRYRTWAFTRIKRAPGAYRAVLRTLEGREIARKEFVVVPAEGALHAPEPGPSPDHLH